MHIPSHFAESRLPVLHELIRARPFATLVAASPRGLDANHVPMLLDVTQESFGVLRGHVGRANPVWREIRDGAEVLVIFHGPEGYVSPRWYPSKQAHGRAVPTWNYVAVHARGNIAWRHEAPWLRALLDEMADTYEGAREGAWKVEDAPPEYAARLLDAIVGFEIPIAAITGKWKLSQNKDVADLMRSMREVHGTDQAS
jgi:transcriptional regulator